MRNRNAAAESTFDVVIVGAGPAGLFAAVRILRAAHATVLIVDGGRDVAGRLEARNTQPDDSETITTGFGGAGLL